MLSVVQLRELTIETEEIAENHHRAEQSSPSMGFFEIKCITLNQQISNIYNLHIQSSKFTSKCQRYSQLISLISQSLAKIPSSLKPSVFSLHIILLKGGGRKNYSCEKHQQYLTTQKELRIHITAGTRPTSDQIDRVNISGFQTFID